MSVPTATETRRMARRLAVREAPAKYGKVRADSLPEFTRYRDDGCDIHAHCLSCPLPRCRYEEPGGLRALMNARRDRQIVALRVRGVPVEELAGRFRVSRRTVFRVLESRRALARKNRLAARSNVIHLRHTRQEEEREAYCA